MPIWHDGLGAYAPFAWIDEQGLAMRAGGRGYQPTAKSLTLLSSALAERRNRSAA